MTALAPDARTVEAILRTDFYAFVTQSFRHVFPGESFVPGWAVEAVAYALWRVIRGECKRLIITMPPRSLKSFCASVALPAFVLGHDPTKKIIAVSYAEGLAIKHANDTRALMRSTLYRRLFPNAHISSSKDTETEFMTTARGSRLATSVGGTLTGRGADLIIIDDPIKPQDAASETVRTNTIQWYSNTLLSRLNNKAEGAIILIMQRLHVDDLAGFLLAQGGWEHLNLPAVAETEQVIPLNHNAECHRGRGAVLDPVREPADVLDEIRGSMSSADFAAQYQQSPVPAGGNMIQFAWFRLYDGEPSILPSDRILVSWDTALSPKELADYSACVVLQVRGGTVYVRDVFRARLSYPDLRRKVIEVHRRWSTLVADYALLIEDRGSGQSLIQDLREEHIHAIAVNPTGDKIMRANAQLGRIEAGAVALPRRGPWLDDFRTEILAFPKGSHDDQVDALSQGLANAFAPPPPGVVSAPLRGLT